MNRKLEKALKLSLQAPEPMRKDEFLKSLSYPKTTKLQFFVSQIGYIRFRTWILSILVLVGLSGYGFVCERGQEVVGLLSAVLPLLTLVGITEISRSFSYNMIELEMSCKYNISKITLIRLTAIGVFHLSILIVLLILLRNQTQYEFIPYALYAVTPFLLCSYISFYIINHLKTKEPIYICSGVTVFISIVVYEMSTSFVEIYRENYVFAWGVVLLSCTVLLMKEVYYLLKEREEQWSFA